VSELSSANDGISNMTYEQVAPSRDVTLSNFSNGAQHFRWECSGQRWWVPSRSYIRGRFKLTKADGITQLDVADNIAPNMGMMSNLYQSAEVRIADKTVSRITDFMPAVDSLNTRLSKSKGWLDSIGSVTNWWDTKQSVRQQQVSSDGSLTEGAQPVGYTITTQANFNVPQTVGVVTAAYDAGTGEITFAGAGASNTNLNFVEGDYFVYTDGAVGDGAKNVLCEVLAVNANLTMTVRANLPADIAGNVNQRFSRYQPTVNQASRRAGTFELVWSPPLSLFNVEHAIPAGRFELILNPQTDTEMQRRAIESALGVPSKIPGAGGNYILQCVSLYLEVCSVSGPRCDDITYLLDLEQTRCQSEKIQSDAFSQRMFDVSPSTYALTVAYADLRAGNNTGLSASKFRSYGVGNNPTVPQELRLNRLFVNYGGTSKPSPDADPSFVAGTDYTVQRYAETMLASGAYYDTGGAETIDEYHQRGAYYYFPFQRDGSDRSTRVTVNNGFDAGTDFTNLRCLLFDHSKQVCRVKVSQGRVTDVQLEEA
jgi:hypothetical protein